MFARIWVAVESVQDGSRAVRNSGCAAKDAKTCIVGTNPPLRHWTRKKRAAVAAAVCKCQRSLGTIFCDDVLLKVSKLWSPSIPLASIGGSNIKSPYSDIVHSTKFLQQV
mmetsp:Transcript_23682/g.35315  ORF Transcript_23682/g.35315 Transcript_23682/m.35315 type:complete len:110 (+) Transcript_23682:1429-1758(+)